MEKINSNSEDDVVFSAAMQLASSAVLPLALKAAVELGLFKIMAASEHNFLTSTEIVSQLHTENANAPEMVERILRFLASSSVLKCEVAKKADGESLLYGMKPVCKYFIDDENGGVSLNPYLLMRVDNFILDAWFQLKDAVLCGGIPFNRAHGISEFDYLATDQRASTRFNQAMHSLTTMTFNKMFEVYKGFEGLTHIVDVGGGTGAALAAIISHYPHVRGINLDLPHVIKDAPPYQGVEHLAGDMFECVPCGEAIFLKHILHNWSDDQCLKLLKNCWKALPDSGKVIVVEFVLPQYPDTDDTSNNVFRFDLNMLILYAGGKERTEREYNVLATEAGFARTKVICTVHDRYVIEFYKM